MKRPPQAAGSFKKREEKERRGETDRKGFGCSVKNTGPRFRPTAKSVCLVPSVLSLWASVSSFINEGFSVAFKFAS